MSYEIKCEHCGSKINSAIEMIGFQAQCSTCGGELTVPVTNFTAGMVSGNYWIQKSMGSGNISEAFIAKRTSDNEKVFLKILSPCVTLVHEDVEQFMIEMCRSHQIDHPNLISVYETGKMNGHYYLATRFVEGECLDKRLERTGPMSEKEALRLCLKIARILRSCWHDFGIVHRSIKPANILINDAGEIFLLDVGNCKQLLISDQVPLDRLDNQGTLADFMSPEEAKGVFDVDCSSDIYSLGATLFFLMTGTKPYSGSDTTQVLLKHLNAPTPSINHRTQEVSRTTAKFIRSMMDTDPENRVYSWREVVGKLKQLLKSKTRGTATDKVLKTHVSTSTDFENDVRTAIMTPPMAQRSSSALKVAMIAIIFIFVLGIVGVIAIVIANKKAQEGPTSPGGGTFVATPGMSPFDQKLNAHKKSFRSSPQTRDAILKRLTKLRQETSNPEDLEKITAFEAILKKGSAATVNDDGSPPELMMVDTCALSVNGKDVTQLTNRGFESGSLAPWKDMSFTKDGVKVSGGSVHAGSKALWFIPQGSCALPFTSKKGFSGKRVVFSVFGKIRKSRPGIITMDFYDGGGRKTTVKKTITSKKFAKVSVQGICPKGCRKFVVTITY